MKKRLFIIGNGFDLAHGLPTNFNLNFRNIAEKNEPNLLFWDLYQTRKLDIWSEFENSLASPDFNSLQEIFESYAPDYISDRESDRDSIILQAEISGNLKKSLYEFALNAEHEIASKVQLPMYTNWFSIDSLFVNFNYTHTLEKLYEIDKLNILHIHGAVDDNELILGYPEGNFKPEKYLVDVTMKGRHFRDKDITDYINSIEDYYVRSAFQSLFDKTLDFAKIYNIKLLQDFLYSNHINEIVVIGHSYNIDYPYFELLNNKFPKAKWILYWYIKDDKVAAHYLIDKVGISNYSLLEA